jgi:hypothetical protein
MRAARLRRQSCDPATRAYGTAQPEVGWVSGKEQRTVSYLLRLWSTRSRGELIWRASLESAETGERRGFADLTDLFAFLEKEISHGHQGNSYRPQRQNKDRRKDYPRKDSEDQ